MKRLKGRGIGGVFEMVVVLLYVLMSGIADAIERYSTWRWGLMHALKDISLKRAVRYQTLSARCYLRGTTELYRPNKSA